MKNFNELKQVLLILFFGLIVYSGYGQSVSGKLKSAETEKLLGFANVDIFKGEALVANVLTDRAGNFKVKLDTGLYICEIKYVGYKKIRRKIRVNADENIEVVMNIDKTGKYHDYKPEEEDSDMPMADISLADDEGAEYVISEKSLYGRESRPVSSYRKNKAQNIYKAWGVQDSIPDSASYGKLTAGEINDFSKWELWTDFSSKELEDKKNYRKIEPTNRFVVQLTDEQGLPLANAEVELRSKSKIIYKARTDNTGKAELWGSLELDSVKNSESYSITIDYRGNITTINRAKGINRSINHVEIATECNQSQNVDIAFVVDATGSMQDEINYLKKDLNEVVYQAKQFSNTLNMRFANIFYRDTGDDYVVRSQNFTRVLTESTAFVTENNAAGGGDMPEAVDIALDSAINNLDWREDTRTKLLFLVLDAPPHNTPEIRRKIIELSKKASEKGIRIIPIAGSGTNKDAEYLMRCIALATNGTYVFLSNHSGIGGNHMEPTIDSYQVEIMNDLLVRLIKSYTYMPDCQQKIADLGVNLPDSQIVIPEPVDTTDIATGNDSTKTTIDNPLKTLEWKFYPNPTAGLVNIIANRAIDELYISDLSGKALQVIRDIQADRVTQIDLGNYPTGLYLIRYPMGKKWVSGKIIIQR